MVALFRSLRASHLARNTGWMLAGQGMRALMQGFYFVIITRRLGSTEYGAFVGAVALAAVLAPYASWGSGNLLIMRVSRNPRVFGVYWGNALLVNIASGSVLLILTAAVARFVLPNAVPISMVLSIALADLVCVRLVETSSQAFQAFQKMRRVAQCQVILFAARLAAAICLLWMVHTPTAPVWAILYLAGSAIAAMVTVTLAWRELGVGTVEVKRIIREAREGFYFAVGLSAENVYDDIDKTLLSKMSTLAITGAYGAAYRIIDAAFTPVRALLAAAYAKFFMHGEHGLHRSAAFAKRLFLPSALYGVLATGAIYLLAPLLPLILGEGYGQSVEVVRWLAILPILKVGHFLAADALTGAGYQSLRTLVQILVAVVNVLLTVWLIGQYSWRGAAVASIISDGLLAAVLWLLVVRMIRSHETGEPLNCLGK